MRCKQTQTRGLPVYLPTGPTAAEGTAFVNFYDACFSGTKQMMAMALADLKVRADLPGACSQMRCLAVATACPPSPHTPRSRSNMFADNHQANRALLVAGRRRSGATSRWPQPTLRSPRWGCSHQRCTFRSRESCLIGTTTSRPPPPPPRPQPHKSHVVCVPPQAIDTVADTSNDDIEVFDANPAIPPVTVSLHVQINCQVCTP